MKQAPNVSDRSTPTRESRGHFSDWQFGIGTLLTLVFVCSCFLAGWRRRHEHRLNKLAQALGHTDQGYSEAANRAAHAMVRHRKFRSSGLYKEILASGDGFGSYQVTLKDVTEVEVDGRREIYFQLWHKDGRRDSPWQLPSTLLVAFAPETEAMSWKEVGGKGVMLWSGGATFEQPGKHSDLVTAKVFLGELGPTGQRTYRLRADGIRVVAEEAFDRSQADKDELLRGMGVSPSSASPSPFGFEGPESDL